MPAPVETKPASQVASAVPLANVTRFLRQLVHDLRNHLNAAELQSAYLAEINPSAESREEIKQLRSTLSHLSADLQRVVTALSEPRLTTMSYATTNLIDDLRQRVSVEHPDDAAKIVWPNHLSNAGLQIDPQLLLIALNELFTNAFRYNPSGDPIRVDAGIEANEFLITIREPKQTFEVSTDNWGHVPMQSVAKSHYGLGLFRSRAIIEAHGGRLEAQYDSSASSLVTTVALPANGG